MKMKYQSYLKLSAKLIVSASVICYVLAGLDRGKIFQAVEEVRVTFLILPFLLLYPGLYMMTLKWRIFLKTNASVREVCLSYWASDFINLFGLGSMGSEAYKAFSFHYGLVSSLGDKLLSLFWYCLMAAGFLSAIFVTDEFGIRVALGSLIFILLATVSIPGLIKFQLFLRTLTVNEKITHYINSISLNYGKLALHAVFCFLYISLRVLCYVIIFMAVGLELKIAELFVLVPFMIVAVTLPVSFQGMGLRELIIIHFARYSMISQEGALIASLLVFLISLFYRFTGFIPFILLRKR